MKVFLLNIYLLFAVAFVGLAQNRPTDAVDFTISDTEGNYYNLFEQFEQGKVVVLYFFSTSCGSCYLEAPVLDTVYENYGLGEQDVLVWGIAYPGATDEQIDIFKDSTYVRFPCLSTAHSTNVFALYDVGYTPQTHVTCNYMASGKIAYQDLDYYIQGCFTTSSNHNYQQEDISIIKNSNLIKVINNSNMIIKTEIFDLLGRSIVDVNILPKDSFSFNELEKSNIYIIRSVFVNGSVKTRKIIF